jgi:hypothetical protein
MPKLKHPNSGKGITTAYVNGLISEVDSSIRVEELTVVGSKTYGELFVSTAGRLILQVRYSADSPTDLPQQLVLKITRAVEEKTSQPFFLEPFYRNEVNFYQRIRPELDLETARCFGAGFDEDSGFFAILLEDLTLRGAEFLNVTKPVALDTVRSLLATQAKLHGRFWESPRFEAGRDLSWVENAVDGRVAHLNMVVATPIIENEIATVQHKRELLQRLRTTGPQMRAGTLALSRHQARLPRTLTEGDMHVGNTYRLPDGSGGLIDWQLMARDNHMHDVNYLITTILSIEERRNHEKELLRFYLDRLGEEGGFTPPTLESTWPEYCRSLQWGFYIGWLTTPVLSYGWEINVVNTLRLATAYEDHGVGRLIAAIM